MDNTKDIENRARGLVVGLLLGDSAQEWEHEGTMHGTCLAQLACFTLDGAIRSCVRFDHRGICHPPGVIWHAWCRWAHLQGLGPAFAERWSGGSVTWPDGWVHQVRPLSLRRGSAPATVAALTSSPDPPTERRGTSAGHHCLTRGLPLAILGWSDARSLATEVALMTHGNREAVDAAGLAVDVVARVLTTGDPGAFYDASSVAGPHNTAGDALGHAARAAARAETLEEAVKLAMAGGPGAVTAAASFFGAAHGVSALPVALVERHEIAWVGDQLAKDAARERLEHPSGGENLAAADPMWWARYPGW